MAWPKPDGKPRPRLAFPPPAAASYYEPDGKPRPRLAFPPPAAASYAAARDDSPQIRSPTTGSPPARHPGMTLPRRVVAETTYLLTRRCLDRRFYLQPSRELNQIYLYALAHAQQKHGVEVHAFACMSNHPHEVVTDVHGVLPDFMRDLRREIALGAKELYKIPENVWAATKPSAVELHGHDAALEEVLYTLLNPVAAGSSPTQRSGRARSHCQACESSRCGGPTSGSATVVPRCSL